MAEEIRWKTLTKEVLAFSYLRQDGGAVGEADRELRARWETFAAEAMRRLAQIAAESRS